MSYDEYYGFNSILSAIISCKRNTDIFTKSSNSEEKNKTTDITAVLIFYHKSSL